MIYICFGIYLAVGWTIYFCIYGIKDGLRNLKECFLDEDAFIIRF